ncbi:hypothetical protein MAA44156_01863 [Mycobacterium avium subsp. avium]|nr:hypothetical protein MAA44156_01863 [Mycobacterium avium subsp. avium]
MAGVPCLAFPNSSGRFGRGRWIGHANAQLLRRRVKGRWPDEAHGRGSEGVPPRGFYTRRTRWSIQSITSTADFAHFLTSAGVPTTFDAWTARPAARRLASTSWLLRCREVRRPKPCAHAFRASTNPSQLLHQPASTTSTPSHVLMNFRRSFQLDSTGLEIEFITISGMGSTDEADINLACMVSDSTTKTSTWLTTSLIAESTGLLELLSSRQSSRLRKARSVLS